MTMTDSQKWMLLAGTLLVGWLIYLLAPMLSPFLTALLLAYLGDPLVDQLERRMSRTWGVVVTFLLFLVLFVVLGFVVIPMLIQQIDQLIQMIPDIYRWVNTAAIPYLENSFDVELAEIDWFDLGRQLDWGATTNVVRALINSITSSSLSFLAALGNFVLIPVVTFYLLRDWDKLVEEIGHLVPRYYFASVSQLARECHETLGAFFRGQLLVMLAQAVIYSIGLMLIGLDLGLLIGMLAGIASIVPYLGTVVGISAGLLAAFFEFGDVLSLVLVLAVFGAGQMLEGMYLTPKLVGDRIGLHPVAVIFAVLAGGQLFGFVGILLALPMAAVIMVLLRRAHENYRSSSFYGQSDTGAETLTEPPEVDGEHQHPDQGDENNE